MDSSQLVLVALQYAAFLLALCVHEFSHAACASWLGDDTAVRQGRLTLSPLAHADLVGSVLLPLMAILGSFGMFGWARPTPVQPSNFRRGWFRSGQVLVSIIGPASNAIQALGWVVLLAVLTRSVPLQSALDSPVGLLVIFVEQSIIVNIFLAAFNLLPVPPLDGGQALSAFLPRRMGDAYDEAMSRYGIFVLLLLLLPILRGVSPMAYLLAPARLVAGFLLGAPFSAWPMSLTAG
jgi:Zn-dependent protease